MGPSASRVLWRFHFCKAQTTMVRDLTLKVTQRPVPLSGGILRVEQLQAKSLQIWVHPFVPVVEAFSFMKLFTNTVDP